MAAGAGGAHGSWHWPTLAAGTQTGRAMTVIWEDCCGLLRRHAEQGLVSCRSRCPAPCVSPPGLPSLARASVRPRLRRFSWLLQAVSDICRQTRVLEADEPAPRLLACLLACVRANPARRSSSSSTGELAAATGLQSARRGQLRRHSDTRRHAEGPSSACRALPCLCGRAGAWRPGAWGAPSVVGERHELAALGPLTRDERHVHIHVV